MGRHELLFTPKTITMVAAWQAAVDSAARSAPCTSHASTAQGEFPPLWGWQGELAGSQGWRGACPGSAAAGEAQLSFPQALSAGVLASITLPCCPSRFQAHLILLGELQPIVGLEPVDVVGEVGHRDGGVVTHACKQDKEGGGRGEWLRLCMAKEGSARACAQQTQEVGARRTRVRM